MTGWVVVVHSLANATGLAHAVDHSAGLRRQIRTKGSLNPQSRRFARSVRDGAKNRLNPRRIMTIACVNHGNRTGCTAPRIQDRLLPMHQAHPHSPEPQQSRIKVLRERISRDEYLPDALQIADKFIDLERILPCFRNRPPRTAG